MIMRIRNRNAEKQKRGFTLTEIAIVLGIVGLILGAIWVAAAAVYNNLRVSRATTELLTIAQNVRAMYATSPLVDTGADMTTIPYTAVTSGAATTYVQANVFPGDMVSSGTGGTASAPTTNFSIVSPWGGSVNVVSAKATSTIGDGFSVNFDAVPSSACIALITGNTGPGRDSGLISVNTNTAGSLAFVAQAASTATTFPVTASNAQALCLKQGATANVGFMFKLKG